MSCCDKFHEIAQDSTRSQVIRLGKSDFISGEWTHACLCFLACEAAASWRVQGSLVYNVCSFQFRCGEKRLNQKIILREVLIMDSEYVRGVDRSDREPAKLTATCTEMGLQAPETWSLAGVQGAPAVWPLLLPLSEWPAPQAVSRVRQTRTACMHLGSITFMPDNSGSGRSRILEAPKAPRTEPATVNTSKQMSSFMPPGSCFTNLKPAEHLALKPHIARTIYSP